MWAGGKQEKNKSQQTHVAVSDGVHGQEVVTVAKLELDHVGGSQQCCQLRLLSGAHLLDEVSQQQRVLAHPLDRLQQVGRQIHLVAQLCLLPLGGRGGNISSEEQSEVKGQRSKVLIFIFFSSYPEECGAVAGQQSVRLGLVLAVQSVKTELLLLLTRTIRSTIPVKIFPLHHVCVRACVRVRLLRV